MIKKVISIQYIGEFTINGFHDYYANWNESFSQPSLSNKKYVWPGIVWDKQLRSSLVIQWKQPFYNS